MVSSIRYLYYHMRRWVVEQEFFRAREVSTLTGLHYDRIVRAIRRGELYAWRRHRSNARPPIYWIPKYAIYAWLGHEGSKEIAKHFDWSKHQQLLRQADYKAEARRLRAFEDRGPWHWDQQTNPLRHWREHLGLSRDNVANQLGVSNWTIRDYEKGGCRASSKALARFSTIVGIPADMIRRMLDQWRAAQILGPLRTKEEAHIVTGARIKHGYEDQNESRVPWLLEKLASEDTKETE